MLLTRLRQNLADNLWTFLEKVAGLWFAAPSCAEIEARSSAVVVWERVPISERVLESMVSVRDLLPAWCIEFPYWFSLLCIGEAGEQLHCEIIGFVVVRGHGMFAVIRLL